MAYWVTKPLHSGSKNNTTGIFSGTFFFTSTTKKDWVMLSVMLTVFNLDHGTAILSIPKTFLNVLIFSATSLREVMVRLESHQVSKVCFHPKFIILKARAGDYFWKSKIPWLTSFIFEKNFLINNVSNFHLCDT